MSTAIAQHIDERAWLEERRKGLGGSDIAAVFGLHPWKTPLAVWQEKTGRTPIGAEEVTPDMRRGRRLEPIAAELYAETTGRRLRRQPLRRHPDYPPLLASIDRQILAGPDVETAALEIKVPRVRTFHAWTRSGLPDYVILQAAAEAIVWGYSYTAIGIYNPEDDAIATFDLPLEDALAEQIIERALDWWSRYVVADTPPPDEGLPTIEGLPEVEGTVRFFHDNEDWLRAAQEWMEATQLVREATAVRDAAKARVIELSGDDFGTFEGGPHRFYYSLRPGRRTLSRDAIRDAAPLDREKLMDKLTDRGLDYEDILRLLDGCNFDLDTNGYREGKPYSEFRGYFIRKAHHGE